MELRQLRYFAATVEESSLSRAARRLHISQPPLSTQIKALEHDLGVKLLERSNRGVKPTLAGAQFYQDIRTLLSRLDQACMRAQHAQRGHQQTCCDQEDQRVLDQDFVASFVHADFLIFAIRRPRCRHIYLLSDAAKTLQGKTLRCIKILRKCRYMAFHAGLLYGM